MLSSGKGKFLVFEGGHGSGKTTLAKKTFDYLINKNKKVISTKEPFDGDIRNLVEKMSVRDDNVHGNLSILYLLAADRFLHMQYIKNMLIEYDFVISDRYVISSFVYQQMQHLSLQLIESINSFCMIPDTIFYIEVPFRERLKRSKKRFKQDSFFRRKYEEEDRLYHKIYEQYSTRYNLVRINGYRKTNEVEGDIIKLISEKFL